MILLSWVSAGIYPAAGRRNSHSLPCSDEVRIGCRFVHDATSATPAVVLAEPHGELHEQVVEESWTSEPELASSTYVDLYGNRCRRLELPEGASTVELRRGLVEIDPEPEPTPGPDDRSTGSRTSPTTSCTGSCRAATPSPTCSTTRPGSCSARPSRGAERVLAVTSWIHENIEYGVPSLPTTSTVEIFERRGGMCRDMAHLGVTFCRALGIPARYTFGYMPDIGVPGPYPPMDFHAWFEVWLGDRWWTLDGRYNTPRIGRVAIGRGRDAADVAMITTYGAATLTEMTRVGGRGGRGGAAGWSMTHWRLLGDLIATLGSIDDDEIDWQNVARTTVLIHQTFRYEYPGPIASLRQRLMVVPPDYHDDQRLAHAQAPRLRLRRRHRALVRHLRQRRARPDPAAASSARSSSRAWIVVEREAGADGALHSEPAPTRRALLGAVAADACPTTALDGGRCRAARPRGATGLELAELVNGLVHDQLRYEWGVTSVATTAAQAWAGGAGVCQDYAHCMLALAGSAASRRATSPGTCSARAARTPGSRSSSRIRREPECVSAVAFDPPTAAAPACGTSPSPSAATTRTSRRPRAPTRGRTKAC